MEWDLRFDRDGFVVECKLERNDPWETFPDWFRQEPELETWDHFYLRAFWDLSTERQIGAAVGPIPATKIDDYACRKGLDLSMMEAFKTIIRTMDRTYLKWLEKERERKSGGE